MDILVFHLLMHCYLARNASGIKVSLAHHLLCSCRRITTGWIGFYAATSQGSILVTLALLLRLVSRCCISTAFLLHQLRIGYLHEFSIRYHVGYSVVVNLTPAMAESIAFLDNVNFN